MQKRIVLWVAILVITLTSCTSMLQDPIPPEERFIKEVFEIDKSKDELYQAALRWAEYNRYGIDFDFKDPVGAGLVGGGSLLIKYRFGHRYTLFILVIQVEDGKVRATVQDMCYMHASNTSQTQLREIDSENVTCPPKTDPVL